MTYAVPTRAQLEEDYALPDRTAARVRMNFVASADGAATIEGRSGGLGDATDHMLMQLLRAMADVVMVGAGTVRTEGYGGTRLAEQEQDWRVAHGLSPQPRLAIVSRELGIGPQHPFFADAVARPIVVTCASTPRERRALLDEVADVYVCGTNAVDLREAVDRLAADGVSQILCEGGPHLFGSLVTADLVDELCLTVSPRLVGGPAGRILRGLPEGDRPLRLLNVRPAGDTVLLRYGRG